MAQKVVTLEALESLARVLRDSHRGEAFRLGDLFLDARNTYGREGFLKVAAAAGLTEIKARQMAWLSGKIPPGDWKRTAGVSYTVLRAVACQRDPDYWVKLQLTENLTCNELKDRIFGRCPSIAPSVPCSGCGNLWSEELSLLVKRQTLSLYFCSWDCLGDYARVHELPGEEDE